MDFNTLHNIPFEYLIIVIFSFVLFGILKNNIASSTYSLRKKYVSLHGGLSKIEAEKALDRHIALLRKKHPGQRLNWYIDRAIYELNKDRRSF